MIEIYLYNKINSINMIRISQYAVILKSKNINYIIILKIHEKIYFVEI